MSRNRWSFIQIEESLKVAYQELGDSMTLGRYEAWRKKQSKPYPSEATIRRQYGGELEVKEILNLGKTKWHRKWTEETVLVFLKQAYAELTQTGQTFNAKNYKRWRQEGHLSAPAYSSILEVMGGFNLIKHQFKHEFSR